MSTDSISNMWAAYLFGVEQDEKLKEIGQIGQLEFLNEGCQSLVAAIRSGINPMQLAQSYVEKGFKWKQLFAEFSYLWLIEAASASRALSTHTWPIFSTSLKALPPKIAEQGEICIGDYGCGPGVQLDQIVRAVSNSLPENIDFTILQEDDNPLCAFAAAVRSLEIKAQHPNVKILTFYNDVRNEHDRIGEFPSPQIGLALASVLPYFTLGDQTTFLDRMATNGTSTLMFSGQVNGFNPYRYFLTGYEGKLFHGLWAEWRFITGGHPPKKAALRYAAIASKLARMAGPVYPDLQTALDTYKGCGWNPTLEKIWIPANGKVSKLSLAKGVIISMQRSYKEVK